MRRALLVALGLAWAGVAAGQSAVLQHGRGPHYADVPIQLQVVAVGFVEGTACRVDVEYVAVEVFDEDGVGGAFEEFAEAALAFPEFSGPLLDALFEFGIEAVEFLLGLLALGDISLGAPDAH